MFARLFPARLRVNLLRAPRLIPVMLLAATLLSLSPSRALCLAASDSGRWPPPQRWAETAIHMALLPGQSPIHSEVMWWQGLGDEDQEFYGGLWAWKPGDYNCASYPDTSILAPIALPLPDSAGMFCSSESQLADAHGSLFLAGGTQLGTENGVRHAYTFDPMSNTWTRVDSMSQARWYPTSTALADGRQLVTSGSHDL